MSDTCGILVPFDQEIWTTKDEDGCLKPHAHNDAHISRLKDNRLIEWEDDYSCKCGCWDEEYEYGSVCRVYRFLTEEEFEKIKNDAMQKELFGAAPPIESIENTGAKFSDDHKYRYSLWRIWDTSLPLVMFIGLNPSTANDADDDPTIKSVRRIAKHNGYGGFYMMNLFGIISSDPEILQQVADPIGDNMAHHASVREKCQDVVFAWGNFKEAVEPAKQFIERYPGALCIKKNRNGSPVHPLFQKGTSDLFPYTTIQNA